jgi:hypothetical protein
MLKLVKNILQLRSRNKIVVDIFITINFLEKSFDELLEGFERMIWLLSFLELRSFVSRARERI